MSPIYGSCKCSKIFWLSQEHHRRKQIPCQSGKQSNVADKSVACVNIGNANKDINISPNDTIGIAKDDSSISTLNNIPQLNAVVNISDYPSKEAAVIFGNA